MGGSIGSDKIAGLAIGGDLVKGAAIGADLWFTSGPPFARQRLNKNGTQLVAKDTWVVVNGWSSDATYPASTGSGGALRVHGGGTVSVTARAARSDSLATLRRFQISMKKNGTEIAYTSSSSGSTTELNWTGTVTDGDLLTMEVRTDASLSAQRNVIASGTYIDVNPT